MRRILLVLALSLLAACAPSGKSEQPFIVPQVAASKIKVDSPALRAQKAATHVPDCRLPAGHSDLPAVTLPCLGGGTPLTLSHLRGPLVLNVWAAWCGPCQHEMPVYAQFAAKHPGLTVLGVDYSDTHPDAALALAGNSGVAFPQLADPSGQLGGAAMRVSPDRYLPIVVLVAADGSIAYQGYQQIDDVAQLEDLVRQHLGTTL